MNDYMKDAERYRFITDDHADSDVRRAVSAVCDAIVIRGKGATDAVIDAMRGGGEVMKSEQIKRRFMDELQHLLVKWDAELTAKDHWEGYPECGEDVRMTVTVPAIYDADHNCLREFTEIDLGSYVAAASGGVKS